MIKDYCKTCKTFECDQFERFLEQYNSIYKTEFEIIECPDKKDTERLGKKPDFLLQDVNSSKEMIVEVKNIYHAYGKGKIKIKEQAKAKENIRNILWSALSSVVSGIIEEYSIRTHYLIEICVFEKTAESYVEKSLIPRIYYDMKNSLINKDYYFFEDNILRILIKKNDYERFNKEQILFAFTANDKRGETEKGITLEQMALTALDYKELLEDIKLWVLKKCKGKFENYKNYKKVIMLNLKINYGYELMAEINKLDSHKGFSFEYLLERFEDTYLDEQYDFVDEVFLYYQGDGDFKIAKLK